ncbi:helix-turn-helix transcriptional regulator [Rhodanobacter sp. DHB23]|uniref:helix-turn-helix domain-containing protein n=1 Tax=Rhodanobacter sp. DHB23 TaxID=2775923 RepID=UPI0017824A58|nr:helix-turn-helix transcriptional regulator [Rhodanobacter sp. DHB23]MBD8873199.1 XRE family transcriptional regulator [Rhodanobacter sp. DHB23]
MSDAEKGSPNAYADLGYSDADEMLVKARLVTKIREIIQSRGWTQQEAAAVLGMPQPKLSNVLRGQFRGVSEAKLMECLTRLGRQVQIVVGPARQTDDVVHVEVVFAA